MILIAHQVFTSYQEHQYNVDTLNVAGTLEGNRQKQNRQKLHLRLLHRSKDRRILLKFMLSRPPTNNPKACDIVYKTGWIYLRLLISECHNKLTVLSKDQIRLHHKVKSTLSESHYSILRQAIAERGEFVMNTVKLKHEQKLQKDQKWNYEQIKKKWVVNISDRALNKNEISVLRKGLNFAMTPKQVPTK